MITARDASGTEQVTTITQLVHYPLTANRPAISGNIAFEDRPTGADRFWVVNQDHNSVSAFNATTNGKLATITVGTAPRALAVRSNGEIWVTNKQSRSISVIDSASLAVTRTINPAIRFAAIRHRCRPDGRQPCTSPSRDSAACSSSTGASGNVLASLDVGPNVRHLSMTGDGSRLYASRFITPPLPGESTAAVQTAAGGQPLGGEVVVVNAPAMSVLSTIVLRHSDKPDFENQGRGVPNYLGAVAISPDGRSAWVPSKQDNVKRGARRDGLGLNFQNTVRAISSRIDLAAGSRGLRAADGSRQCRRRERRRLRPRWASMRFVALETSRQVAVIDAHRGFEIFRFDVGRAPQGLALSADGNRLYVNNFMDRTVGVYDLTELLTRASPTCPLVTNKLSHSRREAHRPGSARQEAVLRRPGHAARPRCLHQLRLLPQRRRLGRPHLGPDGVRRGPAQHRRACAAAPAPRASCTGATTSTRCRISRARSAASPAAPAS